MKTEVLSVFSRIVHREKNLLVHDIKYKSLFDIYKSTANFFSTI